MLTEQEIEDKIREFKKDLSMHSPSQIVRKRIIFGECAILSNSQYLDLRIEVANQFDIHPNNVLVVGSAKLGFSTAPHKRYKPFNDESDIDVVIVSEILFNKFWYQSFLYWKAGSFWDRQEKFKRYLFQGWIRPDYLPPSRRFVLGNEWWEYFRKLTSSGKYGYYKIAGAIYKDWNYIEYYQISAIDSCAQELLEVVHEN